MVVQIYSFRCFQSYHSMEYNPWLSNHPCRITMSILELWELDIFSCFFSVIMYVDFPLHGFPYNLILWGYPAFRFFVQTKHFPGLEISLFFQRTSRWHISLNAKSLKRERKWSTSTLDVVTIVKLSSASQLPQQNSTTRALCMYALRTYFSSFVIQTW